MKVTKAYIALLLVELTSIPLLFLSIIYVLTGYQMLYPEKIHIFQNPRAIHTDKDLRISTIVLGLIHASAGIILLCERRIRNRVVRNALEIATILLLAVIFIALVMIDATSIGEAVKGWRFRKGCG